MNMDITGIQFRYNSQPVLEDVSLNLEEGQVLSLVGPNGSGKTTLLKCINKILKPKKGTIVVGGRNISEMGSKELAHCLGYVPQSAATSFPLMVFDMVMLGRKPHVTWGIGDKDRETVFRMLKLLDLEAMAFRMFNELSGGEKQKVLMARALSQEPEILLLDEPTSNLDLKHQLEVLSIVTDMVKAQGISAVMAIHDLNLASLFSDKIVMLKDGVIYAAGQSHEIINCRNIREVYGVEANVNVDSGRPYVIPLAPRKSAALNTAA